VLVQTDHNSVLGGYCPDQWEDTIDYRNYTGNSGWKEIKSGSPFLFYWSAGKIKIIKHKVNKIACMRSDEDWLILF
jgi:hypothetical protein